MLGSIIGDIAGSKYEYHNIKTTEFDFMGPGCEYTDDSVLTIAVTDWLVTDKKFSHKVLEEKLVEYVKKYRYPKGDYGGGFKKWALYPSELEDYNGNKLTTRQPYNSYGNGSAMRCSSVGWMFDTIEETEKIAEISASITHNHIEGIKGAQATSSAIFLARNGYSKEDIREYIQLKYGYDLHRTCDQIRPTYLFEGSCQKTVPEAIIAFLDSDDFESAIRLGVSLGGDSDTLCCITGGIAEAYYKFIPSEIYNKAITMIPEEFINVIEEFKRHSHYK